MEEDFEIEYLLHRGMPKSKFKDEYPEKGVDIKEKYYIDQAPRLGQYVYSLYTPHGINQIDSWFTKHISQGSDKVKLEFMIKRNVHLHNVIKTNLLENLKNS